MRGFTLLELMIVTVVLVVVATTMAAVATSIERSDRHAAAYFEDVEGLRRALRTLERDVRAAKHIWGTTFDGVTYRRDAGRLLRNGKVVAKNIATFEVEREGDLVTVRLGLGQRAAVPSARRPVVVTRVALRRPEEKR